MNCFGGSFARVVHVDQTQSALKQALDVLLADQLGSEQVVELEIREPAIGNARGKRLQQRLGIDSAQGTNFFKQDALQGILELRWIHEPAQLDPGDRLDQHRT